jgi:hypothetical protein
MDLSPDQIGRADENVSGFGSESPYLDVTVANNRSEKQQRGPHRLAPVHALSDFKPKKGSPENITF